MRTLVTLLLAAAIVLVGLGLLGVEPGDVARWIHVLFARMQELAGWFYALGQALRAE